MSRFAGVLVLVSTLSGIGTLGCRSEEDATVVASEEAPPTWEQVEAEEAAVKAAVRGEVSRMEAEEEAAEEEKAEKGKKKGKKGKGKGIRHSLGLVLQGIAIILTLLLGFGPRMWWGSGSIQSGASIALGTLCFIASWVVFGLLSWATVVAFVVAAWEPLWWLLKWIKSRGGAAPAAP